MVLGVSPQLFQEMKLPNCSVLNCCSSLKTISPYALLSLQFMALTLLQVMMTHPSKACQGSLSSIAANQFPPLCFLVKQLHLCQVHSFSQRCFSGGSSRQGTHPHLQWCNNHQSSLSDRGYSEWLQQNFCQKSLVSLGDPKHQQAQRQVKWRSDLQYHSSRKVSTWERNSKTCSEYYYQISLPSIF
ncbi:hypothetical protein FGO68_gene8514 [Halteria grandinella]|uniref:Uncharacterized protein n=1 Tax=Halteria grandinella TaxID=5974 RepID=A0A8J8NAN0_HALGN|nr:hypothetical protein FGO68_gene8514 [Halteria grandinella]